MIQQNPPFFGGMPSQQSQTPQPAIQTITTNANSCSIDEKTTTANDIENNNIINSNSLHQQHQDGRSSGTSTQTQGSNLFTILPSPIQGQADWRKYRCLKLNNGVTICLVHDKESKTTAMAASVTVGASADPRTLSGLAHFCEHMCFLGSAKYPGENEYKRYLSQHGGRSNGSTSLHLTTYKNEVLAPRAEHLLDVFSNFFIQPLFTMSGTGREINAVDSENSKNVIADNRRRLQILKSIGDPHHYFTKFTTGNSQTLPTATPEQVTMLRDALLAFHEKHYTPDQLTVVVAGPQSLETLQEWVVPRFASIEATSTSTNAIHEEPSESFKSNVNDSVDGLDVTVSNETATTMMTMAQQLVHDAARDMPPYHYTAPSLPYRSPFRPELQQYLLLLEKELQQHQQQQKPEEVIPDESIGNISNIDTKSAWPIQIVVKPVRSMRKVALLFPVPPVFKDRDRSPTSILSHLLGHEGPNSPFAVLQNKGLVSSLSAGSRFSGPDFTVFQIEIGLTELGEVQWKIVVDVILQHCRLIESTARQAMLEYQQLQLTKKQNLESSTASDATEAPSTSALTNSDNERAGAYQYLRQMWVELVQLNTIFFHQSSPGSVYDLAPSLCESLIRHGTEKALCTGNMLHENENTIPMEQLVDFACSLNPFNMIIERCGLTPWNEIESLIGKSNRTLQLPTTTTSTDGVPSSLSSSAFYIIEPVTYNGDGFSEYNNPVVIECKTEPWYNIQYYISRINPIDVSRWEVGRNKKVINSSRYQAFLDASDLIQLPHPNRYIPRTLELCPELPEDAARELGQPQLDKEMNPPTLLIDDNHIGRLWHRLDDRYALPKSSLQFLLRNSATEHVEVVHDGGSSGSCSTNASTTWKYDTTASVHSSLIASIYKEALAQETYDAKLSGLHWELSLGTAGIKIECHGFSDRLPDLFLRILADFLNGDFIQESFFSSVKDRMIRNLKTFFESRRADAQAQYFRDFILSSTGYGIDTTLAALELTTVESTKKHFETLMMNRDVSIDCLFMGNISEKDARNVFSKASRMVAAANPAVEISKNLNSFRPGSFTRCLIPGNEMELHFESKNSQEENGACLVTFQSQIPAFRGESLSSPDSLQSSACIRLLCHMLKEPLFNELRTKQTLGYIVSSYHDLGFSSVPSPELGLHQSIPIDFIVIYVLSKKVAPPELALRIDEFLIKFRESLACIPDSEIRYHSTALSTKMLKPIQNLGAESSTQFNRIRRYAAEVIGSNAAAATTATNGCYSTRKRIPWDGTKTMANKISSLTRDDLLETWDRVVLNPSSRSRITSCVYGTTFPLHQHNFNSIQAIPSKTVIVDSMEQSIRLRAQLSLYDNTGSARTLSSSINSDLFSLPRFLKSNGVLDRSSALLGITAAAVLGVGVLAAAGWTLKGRSSKRGEK